MVFRRQETIWRRRGHEDGVDDIDEICEEAEEEEEVKPIKPTMMKTARIKGCVGGGVRKTGRYCLALKPLPAKERFSFLKMRINSEFHSGAKSFSIHES